MDTPRVSIYDRLPEIYRIKDAEQHPPYQLKNFLALVEQVFGEVHKDIESLYNNLFIETCDEWVIPYIGDLLGVSHLKGDPAALRADVADTIVLRRRKGTLAAIELLTHNLTGWGVHAVELRENLVWSQHLNHQRPDAGGAAPYGDERPDAERPVVARGGTAVLRNPSLLGLLNTPFDLFSHFPDLKKVEWGTLRYNLPNLAVFLWRLQPYTLPGIIPLSAGSYTYKYPDPLSGPHSFYGVRFHVHQLGRCVRLFNTGRYDPERWPPVVSDPDEMPGPVHRVRLNSETAYGHPECYIAVETYDTSDIRFRPSAGEDVGLRLHLPEDVFPEQSITWKFRGARLKNWEDCLLKSLDKYEIAVDPELGRIIIPVESPAQKDALLRHLRITYTYGAVGPVGAHTITRGDIKTDVVINLNEDPGLTLRSALESIEDNNDPLVIEINDSLVHELDLNGLDGTVDEGGDVCLRLKSPLTIRAATDQRPIIRLAHPLRFRPTYVKSTIADEEDREQEQALFNSLMDRLVVRLEGLYLTRNSGFPDTDPLIARAAVSKMELVNCTLDPGGNLLSSGSREAIKPSLLLKSGYGFSDAGEGAAFNQVPEIIINRTIAGPLFIDDCYTLFLESSIIDAGRKPGAALDGTAADYALAAADDALHGWGPPTMVSGITVWGRTRVARISGRGGIWAHALEVFNNQEGCLKFSYFPAENNRLPQWHACVFGNGAGLFFTSEIFSDPAYGQLARASDYAVREQGPKDDAMGAFGFLGEAHKWRNLQIRYREFMPVGIRPLLIPVT
jgi:hypothetical protein